MRTKVSSPPLLRSQAQRTIDSAVRVTTVGKKMKRAKAEEKESLVGPAQLGPSIDDLFAHSYTPPPSRSRSCSRSRTVKSASPWVWVASARVWDPAAEHFSASVRDIRRFGAQAKFLRRVHPNTTDGRSFIEVTMDKRQQSREVRDGDRFRDTKDGERFRDGCSSRDGFQGSRR